MFPDLYIVGSMTLPKMYIQAALSAHAQSYMLKDIFSHHAAHLNVTLYTNIAVSNHKVALTI